MRWSRWRCPRGWPPRPSTTSTAASGRRRASTAWSSWAGTCPGAPAPSWWTSRSSVRPTASSAAGAGDRVWLSGWAGKARGGLFLLQHPEVDVPGRDRLAASYRRPEPRVALGRLLAAEPSVTALIDTSDGVATDLAHVARASGVGVWLDLDRVPRPVGLEEAARAAGQDPEAWLLGGGEDYELLFTATRDFDGIASRVAASAGVPLTPVGEVVPAGEGAWVRTSRGRVPLRPAGWDHFRRHREEGDQ